MAQITSGSEPESPKETVDVLELHSVKQVRPKTAEYAVPNAQ